MIGFLDSGYSGLLLVQKLVQQYPKLSFCYCGDTLHASYDHLSDDYVFERSKKAIEFLEEKGMTTLIICDARISLQTRDFLQITYPQLQIFEPVTPSLIAALQTSRYGRIALAGEKSILQNSKLQQEFLDLPPKYWQPTEKKALVIPILSSITTPLLFALATENWAHKPESRMILKKYILPLKHNHTDTLILLHNLLTPFAKQFQRKMGKNCKVITSLNILTENIIQFLQENQQYTEQKKRHFFPTNTVEDFQKTGEKYLGRKMKQIEQITLS